MRDYQTVAEAAYSLGRYFEFYNNQRLHQALGYRIPAEVYGVAVGTPVAEALVDELIAMASPQIRGLGWGMKHNWMTVKGLIPKDTPCNTQIAYSLSRYRQTRWKSPTKTDRLYGEKNRCSR